MTTLTTPNIVPSVIVGKLRALVLRWRLMVCLRGLLVTAAVGLAALLGVMAVDRWVVIFSAWVRWMLAGGALVVTAAAAAVWLVRPLARSLTLTGVARALEVRHPELQERISSTIELLSSRDRAELRGSEALISALASQALLDARSVRPGREFRLRTAWPYLAGAGGVLTVLATLAAVWPAQTDLLLRRALLANVSRVSHTALHVTEFSAPGLIEWNRDGLDLVMPQNARLHVELEVDEPAVRYAELRITGLGGEQEQATPMASLGERDGRRRFSATCPPAAEAFRFRLHAGDALSRFYTVKVVPLPVVEQIDVRYEFPAYTGMSERVERGCDGTVSAVAGTTATVTVRASKALAGAELVLDGNAAPAEMLRDVDGRQLCTFALKLARGLSGQWSLRLRDEYGFVNEPAEHAVKALLDEFPRIAVVQPAARQLQLRREDRLPISLRLGDDFGLTAGTLAVDVDAQEQPAIPLAIDSNAALVVQGRRPTRYSGSVTLDLAKLAPKGSGVVKFRVRASDNLPPALGGPQRSESETITILLDANAPSFAEQVLLAEEIRVREALKKALEELAEAKKESAPLRHAVPKAKTVTPAITERLDRMTARLDAANELLRKTAAGMAGGSLAGMARKVAAVADDHVAKALDSATQIKLSDAVKQRTVLADEADFQIDRGIAVLGELMKDVKDTAGQIRKAMRLGELAGKQDDLAGELARRRGLDANGEPTSQPASGKAERGERAPPEPPEAMSQEQWKQAQGEVVAQVGAEAKKTPGAVPAQLKRDAQRAKNLLAEARALAKLQAELAAESAGLDPNGRTSAKYAARERTRLSGEQEALAAAAERLADELKKHAAQDDMLETAAARAARDAAGKAAKAGATAEAAADAADAARKLKEIALRLGADVERTAVKLMLEEPSIRPATQPGEGAASRAAGAATQPGAAAVKAEGALAAEPLRAPAAEKLAKKELLSAAVAELAARQQAAARQMKALVDGDAAAVEAAKQDRVSARTAELGESVRLIADQACELIGDTGARKEAGEADRQIGEAGKSQQRARAALGAGTPAAATGPQKSGADSLAAAAAALERLGKALAEASKGKGEEAAEAEDVAEAFDAASEAAASEQLSDAARAAAALKDLASAAAAQAKAMGGEMKPQGPAGESGEESGEAGLAGEPTRGAEAMEANLTPAQLQALGLSPLDWARVRGELRDGVMDAAATDGPAEYRELIQRYFKEVARRGAEAEKRK